MFYQKMSLKNPQNLKKMLRKSAASNAPASVFLEVQKFKK